MDGNASFAKGDFRVAISAYSDALRLLPPPKDRIVLLTNRATAELKLRRWKRAVNDCQLALEENPNHWKALRLRAMARVAQAPPLRLWEVSQVSGKDDGMTRESYIKVALKDAEDAVALQPKQQVLRELLLQLQTDLFEEELVRRLRQVLKGEASDSHTEAEKQMSQLPVLLDRLETDKAERKETLTQLSELLRQGGGNESATANSQQNR